MSRCKPLLVRPEQEVSAVQGYLPGQAVLTGCEYHERLLLLEGGMAQSRLGRQI